MFRHLVLQRRNEHMVLVSLSCAVHQLFKQMVLVCQAISTGDNFYNHRHVKLREIGLSYSF